LTDNRKTRFDLRHALDRDFVAVISRTLAHSAPATRPFGLLLACSLSGTSNLPQPPFPATATCCHAYAGSTGNLAVYEGSDLWLAPETLAFVTVLISFAAESLRMRFGYPLALSRIRHSLRWSSYSQADELADLRRLVLTG